MRVATFNTELSRKSPGILLKDILSGRAPQVIAVTHTIRQIDPDILLLQGVDYDLDNAAVQALASALRGQGIVYPYVFSNQPNTGMRTGFDLNADGKSYGPEDAQGFGWFPGQGGMALFSKFPLKGEKIQDHSTYLWKDLPGRVLPTADGTLFGGAAVFNIQRLNSVASWQIPIDVGSNTLTILATHAAPPVFDGPEDRNGLRNRDQLRFWRLLIDGEIPDLQAPEPPFILMGDLNMDPDDGQGHKDAVRALLSHPALQDTAPQSPGAVMAQDPDHRGNPGLDTVDWPEGAPGNLRVDYVLPSSGLNVEHSGVFWPENAAETFVGRASRHRLVWVDIALP